MNTYDYLAQDYLRSGRDIIFYLNTSDSPAARTTSVTVNGMNGSKLSPRGFSQTISPALDLIVDGAEVHSTSSAANTWTQDIAIAAHVPEPEPETSAMLLAGLSLIGTVARRRSTAKRTDCCGSSSKKTFPCLFVSPNGLTASSFGHEKLTAANWQQPKKEGNGMNKKKWIALLGSLLLSSFAMASTSYTLGTSANLTGNYTVTDSGNYLIDVNSSREANRTLVDTSVLLNTYQDTSPDGYGQWFEVYEWTQVINYDILTTISQHTRRDLSFKAMAGVMGDQWMDLMLTTNSPATFAAYATGTSGSKTSPLGFVQEVTPALNVVADGSPSTASPYRSKFDSSWYAAAKGAVDNSLRLAVGANYGATVNTLGVTVTDVTAVSQTTSTKHFYETYNWQETVPLAAPVPEPETFAMLLAGLGLIGAVARRRRSAAKQNTATTV